MAELLYANRFEGTADTVRNELIAMRHVLDSRRELAALRDDMLIVLGEVLNNIVEHAYNNRADGHVELRALLRGKSVEVQTVDHGRPMPPSQLPRHMSSGLPDGRVPQAHHDLSRADLPEGGFGWFIIHHLTNDMTYERDDGRNKLAFSLEMKEPTTVH